MSQSTWSARRVNGAVFYDGPSRLDGKRVIGVVTFHTENAKTGKTVAQTWILRAGRSPVAAINDGSDASVCGDCPLRGIVTGRGKDKRNHNRGCYVRVERAPLAVWSAWKRGSYPQLGPEHAPALAGKALRYGSYGDPVAIPRAAWRLLERLATGRRRMGYTHQWAERAAARWKGRLLASVHTPDDAARAQAAGWRTFRTATTAALEPGEILCPASAEAGQRRTCDTCGACNGRRGPDDARVSVAIVAHGGPSTLASARRVSLPMV